MIIISPKVCYRWTYMRVIKGYCDLSYNVSNDRLLFVYPNHRHRPPRRPLPPTGPDVVRPLKFARRSRAVASHKRTALPSDRLREVPYRFI